MFNVTIAETQPVYAEGLSKMLSQFPGLHLNQLTFCSQDLSRILKNEATDLLLLDAELSASNTCVSLICRLKEEFPTLKIIMIGNIKNIGLLPKLYRSGIDCYLCKDVTCHEFTKAVTAVLQEEKYLQESISSALSWFYVNTLHKNDSFKLTNREQQVLELIIEEYTNQEIANQLYISLPTVETHRKNLVTKLGVKNTAGLVREAILRRWYPRFPHGKP